MKINERKKIVRRLDKVFSEYIRKRDNYTCIVCGANKNTHVIQAGHLFSRIAYSTRWDEKNSNAQCDGCNKYHEHDFEPYRKAWVDKYGEKEYDILYTKYRKPTKFTSAELNYLIKYYQKKKEDI